MSELRHLRKRGDQWHFQLAVPRKIFDRWKQAGHRDPVSVALGTTSLAEAKRKRVALMAKYHGLFDAFADEAQELSPEALAEVERAAYEKTLAKLADQNLEYDAADFWWGQTADTLNEDAGNPDAKAALGPVARAMFTGQMHAYKARMEALDGRPYELPPRVDARTAKAVQPRKAVAKGPDLLELSERYIAELQRDKRAAHTGQTIAQSRSTYRLLDGWLKLGKHNTGTLTKKHAVAFLDEIAALDPLWGRGNGVRAMPYAEIRERFGNHATGLSNKTVNRYLSALSTLWEWCLDRELLGGTNIWKGLNRPKGEQRATAKLPFTDDEVRALLDNALPIVRPNQHTYETGLAWLMWIAAHSGMRLNEITALRVRDLVERAGVLCFLVDEAKTEAGDRLVPVHSRLVELGLLEYAKHSIVDGHGNDWLIPNLKPGGPDGKRGWQISKHTFVQYRRRLGVVRVDGKGGKDRLDFHSFRRAFVACLENARVPQSEVAQIVGHERAGITFSVYNREGLRLPALKEVVEQVRY